METLRYGIGKDIAKDKFDCCFSAITDMQVVEIKAQASFANSLAETVPSLAPAQEGVEAKKVTPATKTRVTQDKHPSTRRRLPSLAETKLSPCPK